MSLSHRKASVQRLFNYFVCADTIKSRFRRQRGRMQLSYSTDGAHASSVLGRLPQLYSARHVIQHIDLLASRFTLRR